MKRGFKAALVVVFLVVAVVAVTSLMTSTEAKGRCICPQIYAPVECDHGRVFPNQCVANCRNARNCVPIGAI